MLRIALLFGFACLAGALLAQAPSALPQSSAASKAAPDAAFAAVSAGPHAIETRSATSTFDVSAITGAELYRELGKRGPTIGDRHFWAVTRWNVDWSYTYDRRPLACGVKSSSVRLDLAFTYPNWTARRAAPAALDATYESMLAGLKAHEELHADHGRAAAREIRELLASGFTDADCDALGRKINSRADAIIADYTERDRLLDWRSNHGDDTARFRRLLSVR